MARGERGLFRRVHGPAGRQHRRGPTLGDLLLPKTWNDRRRSLAGALLTCAVMGASVVVPVSQATVVPQLALAGLGLGIFVPANNTMIMRGAADSSASLVGGLDRTARGSAPR